MGVVLTVEALQHVCMHTPASTLRVRMPILQKALELADATTPLRAAAMVAQLAFESAWLTAWIEKDDGTHFIKYEGAVRLGNTQPGDGARFYGRGLIQLTGRSNYSLAGHALGIDLINFPSLAADPDSAARIAAWFWNTRDLNRFADTGDMVEITKRINGGTNGLAFRLAAYTHAKEAFGIP
jgi:putative chitinase